MWSFLQKEATNISFRAFLQALILILLANADDMRYAAIEPSKLHHILFTLFTAVEVKQFMQDCRMAQDRRMQDLLFEALYSSQIS